MIVLSPVNNVLSDREEMFAGGKDPDTVSVCFVMKWSNPRHVDQLPPANISSLSLNTLLTGDNTIIRLWNVFF
jgi:hypothetical protein